MSVNDHTIAGHSFRLDESVLNTSGEPPLGSTGPAEKDDERPIEAPPGSYGALSRAMCDGT
jgi:hypothetical protein